MDYDVLIIDDEKGIRELFSTILERAGYTVSSAESGSKGLELLASNTYQMILLDLKMPEMDGTETLRRIRARNEDVPVYIVTAFHDSFLESLKSSENAGLGFQILKKPIEKDQLLKVVEGVVHKEVIQRGPEVQLRLYIADKSRRTENIINNLHEIFQNRLPDGYSLEVINVIDHPSSAEDDNVLATPTLVKIAPDPVRRIIGDLHIPDAILHGLGLFDM